MNQDNTDKNKATSHTYHLETRCVHEGVNKDSSFNSVTTPIYPTSTFAFAGPGQTKGYDYSRSGNPTRAALEESLASLENGVRANTTTTGMAAETTVMHLFDAGAHIIAGHDIYGGSYRLFADVLTKRGLSFSFVDMGDPANVENALTEATRGIWIETPSNPLMRLVDISAMAEIARKHELICMVDNTFMSPYFQRPLDLGADIVMHSTTKYLNGHSDVVGGAIISKTAEMGERIAELTNALGTCNSPFDAWLVLRGVKTLPCRMQAHEKNALALAQFLAEHAQVERVYYPGLPSHPQYDLACRQMSGFGGMLSFDIKGHEEAAYRLIEHLKLYAFAESLGGVESLIEHPASMSHTSMGAEARKKAGITGANIRVSVGIENSQDLIDDMAAAFDR